MLDEEPENGTGVYSRRLILAVDDDPLMLSLFNRVLTKEGFEVRTAADGVFALSLIREHDPDLILLDIRMPGPDGILTLERIREISDVPVIMVTAMSNEESLEKAFENGADDFVKKPFRPDELIARIKANLRRR